MNVVIVGAGGHGKVVCDLLRAAGEHQVVGFLDADPALAGSTVAGLPVLGSIHLTEKLLRDGVRGAVVAIGESRVRRQYADRLSGLGMELPAVIHPSAHVSSTAVLGANVVVAAHAVVSTDARIADCAIVNTAAVVEHECEIGQGAHIGPAAALAGRVRVEAGAFVGLGAKVIQCRVVGQGAIVGAGAVVLEDVEPFCTVVGAPARVVKRGRPHESVDRRKVS